jgi:hypothetical protein
MEHQAIEKTLKFRYYKFILSALRYSTFAPKWVVPILPLLQVSFRRVGRRAAAWLAATKSSLDVVHYPIDGYVGNRQVVRLASEMYEVQAGVDDGPTRGAGS